MGIFLDNYNNMALFDIDKINNIKEWKYSVIDNTFTLKYLDPYWDYCLGLIPKTVAPNLITLINLFLVIMTWMIVELAYSWKLIPFIILSYFMSSTLDGVDGKQARKINNSSGLGELFDHTVDILTLFATIRISTFVFHVNDLPLQSIYVIGGSFFCLSHYKAYINRYMTLDKYSGPNEALIYICLAYCTCGLIDYSHYLNLVLLRKLFVFTSIAFFIYYLFQFNQINSYRELNMKMMMISLIGYAMVFFEYSYTQIILLYVLLNATLISSKMAKSIITSQAMFIMVICLTPLPISMSCGIISLCNTFYQIKSVLDVPFLNTF